MASNDALDRTYRRFGKEQKREWAKKKAEEDEAAFCDDPCQAKKAARKFDEIIRKQRKAAGL